MHWWWFFWKVSCLVGTTRNEAWKLPWPSWVLEVELCSVCSRTSDLSNKLWTIHGIEPTFLSAAHQSFPHRVTALSFSKPFSHQSWGNPTLQSPTLTCLCTLLTFACAVLKLLVNCCISFTLSSSIIFFVKSSRLPSHWEIGVGTVKCSAFHVWGGWASLSQPGLDLALLILTSAFLPFQGETDPIRNDETQQFPLIPAHTRDWKFTFSLSSHSFLYLHSSLYFLPCFITIYLYPNQRFLLIQVWVVYKQEFHFSVSAAKYLFKKCSLNICDDYFKVRICLPMQKTYEILVWSMSQEDPLEKEMATHSGSLFFFF